MEYMFGINIKDNKKFELPFYVGIPLFQCFSTLIINPCEKLDDVLYRPIFLIILRN